MRRTLAEAVARSGVGRVPNKRAAGRQSVAIRGSMLYAAGLLCPKRVGGYVPLKGAFAALERQLASPEGDTLVSEPVRRVPRRRR